MDTLAYNCCLSQQSFSNSRSDSCRNNKTARLWNARTRILYNYKVLPCTYVVFPLPLAPIIAFIPGRNIPLSKQHKLSFMLTKSSSLYCIKLNYCPRGSDGLHYYRLSLFFSVSTITHEPLHSAWCNFAQTCILATARNPQNFSIIRQNSRSFQWTKVHRIVFIERGKYRSW